MVVADSEGRTPLHWAVDRGHISVVEILLSKNADVNAKVCAQAFNFRILEGHKFNCVCPVYICSTTTCLDQIVASCIHHSRLHKSMSSVGLF